MIFLTGALPCSRTVYSLWLKPRTHTEGGDIKVRTHVKQFKAENTDELKSGKCFISK